jgi:hypothetical protein
MSRKKNAKHWYQVHKSRAGTESVEYSKGVAEARVKVRELEGQFFQMMVGTEDQWLQKLGECCSEEASKKS